MKNKKISFIYFDLGGVVINNIEAIERVTKDFHISKETFLEVLDANWQAACRGDLSNDAYLKIWNVLGVTHPKNDFLDLYSEYQGIYTETIEFIYQLKQQYKLGILSNAELGLIDRHMQKGKIPRDPWTVIIESAQHGTIKPEKRIYEIAEQKAGVHPSEIFFIDDRPEMLAPAVARGWQGMVFDSLNTEKSIKKIKKSLGL